MKNTDPKYAVFSAPYLIKTIQELHLKLEDPAYKKKIGATHYTRALADLRDMRSGAIFHLTKMDRTKKEFFPIGSLVEYKFLPPITDDWWSQQEPTARNATVKGYDGEQVLIQLEGEEMMIKVEPIYLTLRFIRTKYY